MNDDVLHSLTEAIEKNAEILARILYPNLTIPTGEVKRSDETKAKMRAAWVRRKIRKEAEEREKLKEKQDRLEDRIEDTFENIW